MSYIPSTGPQALYQDASLSLCPESSCPIESVQTLVLLETSHIGKGLFQTHKMEGVCRLRKHLIGFSSAGCDRDTYSLASQRQLCGADSSYVDLLPGPESKASWTKNMIRDRGQSADSSMVMLTGSDGYDVPAEQAFSSAKFPSSKFTLATWMRHRPREQVDKHRKEHIICQADDHSEY